MAINYLVIGEACKDVFEYGHSNRLSPEAPVPIFIPEKRVEVGGMAKNVFNNLLAIIRNEKLNDSVYHIFSRNEAIKKRLVDSKTNHYFLRIDEFDEQYEQIDFNPENEYKISNADCIIISDYGKGFLTEDDIAWISELKKKNAFIFLDTKKVITEKILSSVDYVKINEKEYLNNLKKSVLNNFIDKLIVTLGERGAMYNYKVFPVNNPQNTIDVSGAGDTFLAGLAYKYMITNDIVESIHFSNTIAGIVVTKKGVATI
jgi:D-beta-D-heptose 7-phosphate kinase/D-beta-D-heptose 1-phosphate adenosyltransferase